MRVAVVGAGIHGASTAKSLAETGHEVSLFDQFGFGHTMGSSHGESRIVRKAYPDAYYTSLMAEAYPLWKKLELEAGEKLLHEVGLLYFGDANSSQLRSIVEGLQEVGVPHDILTGSQVRRISPNLQMEHGEIGVFTPEAGWVNAAVCLAATMKIARGHGVTFHEEERMDVHRLESEFDAYVVAPGAWIRDWAPDIDVQTTLQTVAFFDAEISGPVWIQDSEDLPYGFPTQSDGVGAKLAFHSPGLPVDPNQKDRDADHLQVEALAEILSRRFGIRCPRVRWSYGCLYTTTSNEDFRLGRLGTKGYYASACSGHGFKFGPWIGKLLANFVEGKDEPERWSRFSTGSKPAA